MDVLIIGCGWVGTYTASRLLADGHRVWGTTTSPDKMSKLTKMGVSAVLANFDGEEQTLPPAELIRVRFDLVIISVPITRKDTAGQVHARFANLLRFMAALQFNQSVFFGSVGIYPKVNATIAEHTFPETALEPNLWWGESVLRAQYSDINVLRLGGLFGLERTISKHFSDKVCHIGYQPANFVHVEDIFGVIQALIAQQVQGQTYNVVSPEHPLKKEVIAVSAAKYGYGLPSSYTDADKTAKIVSPARVIDDLG